MNDLLSFLQTEKNKIETLLSRLQNTPESSEMPSIYSLIRLIYQSPYLDTWQSRSALNELEENLVQQLNSTFKETRFTFERKEDLVIRYSNIQYAFLNYKEGKLELKEDIVKLRFEISKELSHLIEAIKEGKKQKEYFNQPDKRKDKFFIRRRAGKDEHLKWIEKDLDVKEMNYVRKKKELQWTLEQLTHFEEDARKMHAVFSDFPDLKNVSELLNKDLSLDLYIAENKDNVLYKKRELYFAGNVVAFNPKRYPINIKKEVIASYSLSKKICDILCIKEIVGDFHDTSMELVKLSVLNPEMKKEEMSSEKLTENSFEYLSHHYSLLEAVMIFKSKSRNIEYQVIVNDFGSFTLYGEFIDVLYFLSSTPIQNFMKR